jgi:hypothetical protein
MFVPGLGNSAGRRADQRWATSVKAVCGGKQIKMTQEEQNAKLQKWRHPDLLGVSTQAIQKLKDIHNSVSNVEH